MQEAEFDFSDIPPIQTGGFEPLPMDRVPASFEEAVLFTVRALGPGAINAALELEAAADLPAHEIVVVGDDKQFVAPIPLTKSRRWAVGLHMTLGTWLREYFSLWTRGTALDRDFWRRWKIWHGDDKSTLICLAAYDWINCRPYKPQTDVLRIHKHWGNQGQEAVPPPPLKEDESFQ